MSDRFCVRFVFRKRAETNRVTCNFYEFLVYIHSFEIIRYHFGMVTLQGGVHCLHFRCLTFVCRVNVPWPKVVTYFVTFSFRKCRVALSLARRELVVRSSKLGFRRTIFELSVRRYFSKLVFDLGTSKVFPFHSPPTS